MLTAMQPYLGGQEPTAKCDDSYKMAWTDTVVAVWRKTSCLCDCEMNALATMC